MNKKFFRPMLHIIAASVFFSPLAGCSPLKDSKEKEKPEPPRQVVMWKFKSNKEDYMIYDWVKQWNSSNRDIQVEFELIPYNDYLTNKLPTAFATNSAPDVYMISAGGFMKYAKAGCMQPLDEYMDDSLKKDFYEQSLNAAMYDGKIMGLPIEREPVALFYNKNRLTGKGVDPPANWDELEDSVKKLNSDGMTGINLPWQPNDYQNFIFYSFLMQAGGVIDGETGTSKFKTSGLKALKLWRTLSKYNYKSEATIQLPSDIYPLASGKTSMQVCGYWAVKMLERYYPDFEYGAIPIPGPADGIDTSVYGGWFQVVNPNRKNVDAAAEFTVWMWGKETVRPLQWCTEASSKFPARKSVVAGSQEKAFSSPVSEMFKTRILPNAIPEPRYPVEMSNIVSRSIQEAMFTDKSIEDIANSADKEINQYLKANGLVF